MGKEKANKGAHLLLAGSMCIMLSGVTMLTSISNIGVNINEPSNVLAASYEESVYKKVKSDKGLTYNGLSIKSSTVLERYIHYMVIDGKQSINLTELGDLSNQLIHGDRATEFMEKMLRDDFYSPFIKGYDIEKSGKTTYLKVQYNTSSKNIKPYLKKANDRLNAYAKVVKKQKTTSAKYNKAYDLLYKAKYGGTTSNPIKGSYYYTILKGKSYGVEGANDAYRMVVKRAGLKAESAQGKADLPGVKVRVGKVDYYVDLGRGIYNKSKLGLPHTYQLLSETEYSNAVNYMSEDYLEERPPTVKSKLDYYSKKNWVATNINQPIVNTGKKLYKEYKSGKRTQPAVMYFRMSDTLGLTYEIKKNMEDIEIAFEEDTKLKHVDITMDESQMYFKVRYAK